MTPPDSVERIALEMKAHSVMGSRIAELDEWATRLQALDRQRQEGAALQFDELLNEQAKCEAAEAALAEARGLLHETGRYLDPRHYAAQIAKLTAFLTRTAKEPTNG